MSGKNITLLVCGIILCVVLYFFFQRPGLIELKTLPSGARFFSQCPPPFISPASGPLVIHDFTAFPFYGEESSPQGRYLKIFLSRDSLFFGLFFVDRREVILREGS